MIQCTLRKRRTIILWNVTWFSNLQIGPDVVADRGPISCGDRCRRRLLPVDVAAPPPAAAAPAPLEARCRLVGVEQRRPGNRPIGHRGRRRHPRRPARWRRLAVSMEADARPADAGASVAERRGRHPEPRQPRVRVLPAKGWVREMFLSESKESSYNCTEIIIEFSSIRNFGNRIPIWERISFLEFVDSLEVRSRYKTIENFYRNRKNRVTIA